MKDSDIVRFDWAIKRLLRDKANFGILEGLFKVLLNHDIKIMEVLESESNQQFITDKFNRVDMMVKDENEEIFIIEVQLSRDLYFMQRILYGTSKAITEHISLGESYKNVKKIYSINILYFDLGMGKDFLYHGQTVFRGVFQDDILNVRKREREFIEGEERIHLVKNDVFLEYYLIRVNQFNDVAKTPIEEWMSFLKNGVIAQDATAPGLQEAREKLRISNMNETERKEYFAHVDAIMTQNDTIENYKSEGRTEGFIEGRMEGFSEGLAEGERKEKISNAKYMKKLGIPVDFIQKVTGLSENEIEEL